VRVAIQGERGSFSHKAALALVPELGVLRSCALSPEVFECLVRGDADAAVVPIENSLAGSVLEHYDLLLAHPLHIAAEFLLRIGHNLIAAPGVTLGEVREVYSHPVALAQCRRFFAEHPQCRPVPFYDTAGAVVEAVRSGAPVAAIAGSHAVREHGGSMLVAGIEDNPENYTRFLLLYPGESASTASTGPVNKVSLVFSVLNEPGSLVRALQIFARRGLNLTRLESRPVPGSPWEYVFYTDYQLGLEDEAASALVELNGCCSFVKELGRYTAAAAVSA
jgi:prephenate dehydratase